MDERAWDIEANQRDRRQFEEARQHYGMAYL